MATLGHDVEAQHYLISQGTQRSALLLRHASGDGMEHLALAGVEALIDSGSHESTMPR